MYDMQVPNYASKKYINTVNILKRSTKMLSLIQDGHEFLGPIDNIRLKRTHEQIVLKEKVLGFLEAYTNGTVHTQNLPMREVRELTDILLAENPSARFKPTHNKVESYKRLLELRAFIDNSQNKEFAKQELLRVFYIESTPSISLDRIENVVLAGGGAKALSLAGAIRGLEKNSRSDQIKRVAGTSGGAIVAMAYAIGYNSKELDSLILDNNFGLFTLGSRFDNAILNQWSHYFKRNDTDSKLHVLSDNSIAHKYHKELIKALCKHIDVTSHPYLQKVAERTNKGEDETKPKALFKLIKSMTLKEESISRLVESISQDDIIKLDAIATKNTINDMGLSFESGIKLYKTPQQALNNALRHGAGIDLVRAFFSDVIYKKLKDIPDNQIKEALYTQQGLPIPTHPLTIMHDIRNINFKQLQSLKSLSGSPAIKELHISMSIQKESTLSRFSTKGYDPYYHVDTSHLHPDFSEMPIAEAVRVSMNLPPIYPQYKFNANGKRYLGSDGGIKSNVSLNTFDQLYPPEQTIGVIYKTREEISNTVDVKRMLSASPSRKKTEKLIAELEKQDIELKSKQKQYDSLLKSNLRPESRKNIESKKDAILDSRRQINGRLAEQKDALHYIDYTQSGTLKKWVSEPLGEIGRVLGNYLDGKSHDDLLRTKNLKRLAMVNTHDIKTWDFKMTDDIKEAQINNGEKAMNSLLNGVYCLENHFFYHHIKSIQQQLVENGLSMMLQKDIDENSLLPYHEVEPQKIAVEEAESSLSPLTFTHRRKG